MSVLLKHKFKILAFLGAVSVIGIGVGVPMSVTTDVPQEEFKRNDKENVKLVNRPKIPDKIQVRNNPKTPLNQVPVENIDSKLSALGNRRTQLMSDVSNQITKYKLVVDEVKDINRVESELNQCTSKDEISTNITDPEKTNLKTTYESVKSDLKKYQEIQNKVDDSDMKEKIKRAENHKDDESYKEFEDKFKEVENEYNSVNENKSMEKLTSAFLIVYNKLHLANRKCSFYDVIKMNNMLGQYKNSR